MNSQILMILKFTMLLKYKIISEIPDVRMMRKIEIHFSALRVKLVLSETLNFIYGYTCIYSYSVKLQWRELQSACKYYSILNVIPTLQADFGGSFTHTCQLSIGAIPLNMSPQSWLDIAFKSAPLRYVESVEAAIF